MFQQGDQLQENYNNFLTNPREKLYSLILNAANRKSTGFMTGITSDAGFIWIQSPVPGLKWNRVPFIFFYKHSDDVRFL